MGNVLEGDQINERFFTHTGERMVLLREVENNYEFRYQMQSLDNGDRVYYDVNGRTPLNYDPARYILGKVSVPTPAYAEVPVGPSYTFPIVERSKPPARTESPR